MTPTDTSQRRRGRTPVTLAAALTAALISLLVTACTDTLDAVDSLAQPVTPAWTVALETLGTPNHTVGERILTTAMDGESATRMVGLDLADGSEVWSRPIGAWSRDRALVLVDTEEGHRAVDVGPARSQRINATWEGVLLAWTVRTSALQLLDPHDGEVAAAHPVPDHGLVASVEDVGDFLHVVAAVPTQPDPAGPAEDGTWPLGREVRDYIFDPRSATFSDPTDLGLEVPWVPLTDGLAMTWPEGSATPSLVSLRHEDAGHSVPLPDTLSLTRETLLTRAKATGRVPDSGHVAFGAAGATGDGEVDLASFRTILVDLDSGELVTGPLPGRPCGSRGATLLLCTGTGRTVAAAPGTQAVLPDRSGFTALDAESGEEAWSLEQSPLTRADEHARYADSSRFLTFTRADRLAVLDTGSGDVSDLPDGSTVMCTSSSSFTSDLNALDDTQVDHFGTRHFPCGAGLAPLPGAGAGWTLGMVEAGNWWTQEAGGSFAPLPDQEAARRTDRSGAAPDGQSGPRSGPQSDSAGSAATTAPAPGDPGTVHLAVSHEDEISFFVLAVH